MSKDPHQHEQEPFDSFKEEEKSENHNSFKRRGKSTSNLQSPKDEELEQL